MLIGLSALNRARKHVTDFAQIHNAQLKVMALSTRTVGSKFRVYVPECRAIRLTFLPALCDNSIIDLNQATALKLYLA